jgi:chaperonin GroEL (HSP60 family)
MKEAGILDPLKVVRIALETGASAGMMALTTDALVLTAKRDPAINP